MKIGAIVVRFRRGGAVLSGANTVVETVPDVRAGQVQDPPVRRVARSDV